MTKINKNSSKTPRKPARRAAQDERGPNNHPEAAAPGPTERVPAEPVEGSKGEELALPAPVKAKRNAGLSSAELKHFRELLLAKRGTLVGDVTSMANEALGKNRQDASGDLSNMPIHMADIGSDNYEQEFTLGLLESEQALLREINAALARMDKGTFGICLGTGRPIGKPRLEAKPWAKYSIDYARQVERGASPDIEVEDPGTAGQP